MLDLIYGFTLGTLTATLAGMLLLEKKHQLEENDKRLVEELTKENAAYRKVISKWRAEQDKTYWG